MGRLFGTNGIRGVVNKEMTAELALKIGRALGTYFKSGRVLVGMDGRTSGVMLKSALTSGLLSAGVDVVDVGLAPTPAIQYATKNSGARGSVIITASHNPAEFNGIKVVDYDGIEISTADEGVVESLYYSERFHTADWLGLGKLENRMDILEPYKVGILRKVRTDLIKKANLKVVIDSANSVGGLVTPYLTAIAGCETVTINTHIDGLFPGRDPEPNDDTLTVLKKTVLSSGADLGIAHDGDADRVVFVDEGGVFLTGDKTFALLIKKALTDKGGGKVVTPIASSNLIKDVTEEFGGELVTTRVGSVVVARTLKEVEGLIGGEENGGIFYSPHQYVRDGAMGAMLLLEYIAEAGKPLSKLVAGLPKYYQIKKKVKCSEQVKDALLRKLREELKNYEVDTTDGLKILLEKGWVLIRPSGTEPIIRCYAESHTRHEAERLSSWGLKLINDQMEKTQG